MCKGSAPPWGTSRPWAPARRLRVAADLVAATAALFALPDNPDALDVPAGLVWEFRLWSIATALLLWAVLGAVFGLLGERAARRATLPVSECVRARPRTTRAAG